MNSENSRLEQALADLDKDERLTYIDFTSDTLQRVILGQICKLSGKSNEEVSAGIAYVKPAIVELTQQFPLPEYKAEVINHQLLTLRSKDILDQEAWNSFATVGLLALGLLEMVKYFEEEPLLQIPAHQPVIIQKTLAIMTLLSARMTPLLPG